MKSRATATILQSGICVTNAFPRPRPSLFFFPGLHSQPIYSHEDFQHSDMLTSSHSTILKEYLNWRSIPSVKSDYEMNTNEHKLHNGVWDWNSYILKGKKQADFAIHCPQTATILETIPSLMHSIPFSYAFFSTLRPQTKIDPHFGPCNIRLRCHLPLLVPEGDCGMRIGQPSPPSPL
jgi:aspartyl/asparaginyl beta-hydroxylase (cupin superfamily)